MVKVGSQMVVLQIGSQMGICRLAPRWDHLIGSQMANLRLASRWRAPDWLQMSVPHIVSQDGGTNL